MDLRQLFLVCAIIPVVCFAENQLIARGEEGRGGEGRDRGFEGSRYDDRYGHDDMDRRNDGMYGRDDMYRRNDGWEGAGYNNGGNVYVMPENNQPNYYIPPVGY